MKREDIDRIGEQLDKFGATQYIPGGKHLGEVFRLARLALEAGDVLRTVVDACDEISMYRLLPDEVDGFAMETRDAAAAFLARLEGTDAE